MNEDTNNEESKIAAAVSFNTLPEYLYKIPQSEMGNSPSEFTSQLEIARYIDLYSEFKKGSETYPDNIHKTFDKYKDYLIENNMVPDMLKVWIIYNPILNRDAGLSIGSKAGYNVMLEKALTINIKKNISDIINSVSTDADITYKLTNEINNVYGNLVDVRNSIELYIKKKVHNFSKELKQEKKLSLAKEVYHTNLVIENASYNFILTPRSSLLDIFNNLHLNETIPFASYNNYYKIYDKIIPPEEWKLSLNNTIIVKVNVDIQDDKILDYDNSAVSSVNPIRYKNLLIYIDAETNKIANSEEGEEGENGGNSLHINIEYDINSKTIPINDLIDIIKKSLTKKEEGIIHSPINITPIITDKLKGIYYYPKFGFNKYLFADLVMNNVLFSKYLYINESERASKQKNSVYVHFKDGKNEVAANITEKVVSSSDYTIKHDIKLFPFGSKYVRVKITKGSNIDISNKFIEIFSKLLSIYKSKEKKLMDYYSSFIKGFGKESITYKDKDTKLKNLFPQLFVGNFSTKCPHLADVANEEEVKDMAPELYLKFPKETDPQVLAGNIEPQYFVCTDEKYKYPGLLANNLDNKDIYPYLPCCYATKKLNNKNYKAYYHEEEIETDIKQQKIINTNKIANINGLAYLPDRLHYMFQILDITSTSSTSQGKNTSSFSASQDKSKINLGTEYYRLGVNKSPSSFLECILQAIKGSDYFVNKNDRLNKIKKYRRKMKIFSEIARQENYDESNEDILALLRNEKEYLPPDRYISMFEYYFKCTIYLFNSGSNELGEMVLPRYTNNYYKFDRKTDRNILIYYHMGSKADNSKYPQCELICRGDTSNLEYLYDDDDPMINNIKDIYNQMVKFYIKSKEVYSIGDNNAFNSLNIVSQYIDIYGKCRYINIEFKGEIYTILTTPLPPFNIKSEKYNPIKWNKNKALDFINGLGLTYKIKGDEVVVNNIGNSQSGIIKLKFLIGKSENNENLERFIENKKSARYITELFLYVFSHYLNKRDITIIDDDTIYNFSSNIVYDENINYENITRNILSNNKIILRDNDFKIVLSNEELAKRLIYVLRLRIESDYISILNYWKNQYIQTYYIDITDFDIIEKNTILYGDNSINKWIMSKTDKTLYNIPNVDVITPYYLFVNTENKRSKQIPNSKQSFSNIYLAQNSNDINSAIYRGYEWYKNKYNIQNMEDVSELDVGYLIYIPKRQKGDSLIYNLYRIGNIQNIICRIAIYQYGNVIVYITLMKL